MGLALKKIRLYKTRLLRGCIIGFIISVVVTMLSLLGHFKPYENQLTDFLQTFTHKKVNDVVLLFITEKEYKEGFGGISPLSRSRLADMIHTLVKLKAKVIALDLTIADQTNEDPKLSEALALASAAGIPVVVIGNLKEVDDTFIKGGDPPEDFLPYKDERVTFSKEDFLLFEDINPGSQWLNQVMYGGVIFRLDRDGVLRQAETIYMVKGYGTRTSFRPVPSFPLAVVSAYLGRSQVELEKAFANSRNNRIILNRTETDGQYKMDIQLFKCGRITPNFVGNYRYFNHEVHLSRLLEDYGPGKPGGSTIFMGKIVIVGGVYDARDFYLTPVGRMSGMEILANITQSILSDNLITHANFYKAFAFEVILGTIVALLFVLTTRFWATVVCFVALVPAVTGASLLSFSTSYHWFDFIPTIAGVILHGWVSKAENRNERRRALL